MPVAPVDSLPWWVALGAVLLLVAALSAGERAVLVRLARDPRPALLRQRARRAACWLVALAGLAAAQLAALAAWSAGADWAGTPGPAALAVAGAALAVALAALVVLVRSPAPRRRVPVPPGLLAPAALGAAADEVVFRGALLGVLVVGVPAVSWAGAAAVAVSAAAFGLSRVTRDRGSQAAAAVTGAVLAVATLATGWVVVPVLLHIALLLVVAAAGVVAPQRAARAVARGADAAGGCGNHDPDSPSCVGCPLAPAAARRPAAAV